MQVSNGRPRAASSGVYVPIQSVPRLAFAALIAAVAAFPACSAGSGSGAGTALFATHGGGNPPPENGGGAVVAVLELTSPSVASFVLHGTVPVPKGTYPRTDGKLPFSIRNSDGNVVPTQVEIVSRYPDDKDGADVVEVLARVDRPAGIAAGFKIQYQVVDDPHPSGPLPATEAVAELLRPGKVLLLGYDAFGNEYRLDLFRDVRKHVGNGAARILRKGPAAVQVATYGTMRPLGPKLGAPDGALPHFFGAHAYATAWRDGDVVSLDLHVNNGPSGADKSDPQDDPLGKVYFSRLELVVPSGWTLQQDVEDPYFGVPYAKSGAVAYPIVAPMAGGQMHVMPPQAQFVRRLALAPAGKEAEARSLLDMEWLGYARRGPSPDGGELYSWWNPLTSRYFPQRHKLPDLSYLGHSSVESKLKSTFKGLDQLLRTGAAGSSYPISSPVLGWAHPWGVKYGGMTGGTEVWLFDGFMTAEVSSREGYRTSQIAHRMYTDRQPVALYDKDGKTTCLDGWVVHGAQGDYVNFSFFLKPVTIGSATDPFGYKKAPTWQADHVKSAGLTPSYEVDICGYSPIDFQHYTRYTRSLKVLAWLGNDAVAKDDLRQAAELFRLSWHDLPNSANGAVQGSGLLSAIQVVQAYPGTGMAFGRGEGWGLDAACAAYSVSDPAWRAGMRPWMQTVADTVAMGQSSCNGFIQAIVSPKLLNGNFKGRQSIEQAIGENALWSLRESVLRDADLPRFQKIGEVIEQSTYAMIGPMAWHAGSNGGWSGPWSHLAVAPLDPLLAPYCGSLPSGGSGNGPDKYQTWTSFAYGYELTGDPIFLQRATEMSGKPDLWSGIKAEGFGKLENMAGLIAVMQ